MMKTIHAISALFVCIAFSLSANAQGCLSNFVVTPTDTLFCKTIKVKPFHTICRITGEEVVKIDNNEVVMYANEGRMFQKRPVYRGHEKTNQTAMMEIVEYRNGLCVYKHEHYNTIKDCTDATFYYYYQDKLVNSQINPGVKDVNGYLESWKNYQVYLAKTEDRGTRNPEIH